MSATSAPLGRDQLRAFLQGALEAKLETILAHARPTGQFGTDPWIVRDQDAILTLTLLYQDEDGPHYHDAKLLDLIAAGGRFLKSRQDGKGMHRFDKKDGSYWGQIYMPWTYLRWIITYDLIKDELAPADQAIWAEALELGYGGIAATELSSASNIYPGPLPGRPPLAPGEVRPWIHNIPSHHATGLFVAGRVFNRPEWQQQARDYMQLVIAEQTEHGWWTEHIGPVVLYNRVYLEALGIYHALTGEKAVLPALERGNRYHLNYLYPNGAQIETVDERNPYPPLKIVTAGDGTVSYEPPHIVIHPGLYYTDAGRAFLAAQLTHLARRDPATIDGIEFLYLFLPAASDALNFTAVPTRRHSMGPDALVAREDPWIVSLSAYCCPRTPNRFIQDRQNLVSIYHRDTGLILGGGNTKLQPRWSTLTVGDVELVSPLGAKRDTNLAPEVAVAYTPESCAIAEPAPNRFTQSISAAGATIEWAHEIVSATQLRLSVRLVQAAPDGRAVATHLTFIPYLEHPVIINDEAPEQLTAGQWTRTGIATLAHHGWKLALPATAEVTWPVLPHNPYTDDGHAAHPEGRLVVSLSLDATQPAHELTLTVKG